MPSTLCLCDLARAENLTVQVKFEKHRFSLESAAVEGTSLRGVKRPLFHLTLLCWQNPSVNFRWFVMCFLLSGKVVFYSIGFMKMISQVLS